MAVEHSHDNYRLARHVNSGFNIIAVVFQCAANILLTLRLLESRPDVTVAPPDSDRVQRATIAENLGGLHEVINDLPDLLQRPWESAAMDGRSWNELDIPSCHVWTLYTNVMLTYYCLQMILLRRATGLNQTDVLGYSPDASLLALHALCFARSALQVIRSSPFEALQVNGESSVRS